MRLSNFLGVGLVIVGAWLPVGAYEQMQGPAVVYGEGAAYSNHRPSYSPDSSRILLPFTGGTYVVNSSDGSLADAWEGKFDGIYVGDRGVAYATRLPGEYAQTHVELNAAHGARSYIIPAAVPYTASRDGSVLALFSLADYPDFSLILWDVAGEQELLRVPFTSPYTSTITAVGELSPDGSKLITRVPGENVIVVRSTTTGEVLWQKVGYFESAGFLSDGVRFIIGGQHSVPDFNSVTGFRTTNMAAYVVGSNEPAFLVEDFFEQPYPDNLRMPNTHHLTVDSDRDRLAATIGDNFFVADTANSQVLWEAPYNGNPLAMQFSRDGGQFNVTGMDGRGIYLQAYDAGDGALKWTFEAPETVYNLRGAIVGTPPEPPNPADGQLLYRSESGEVSVWWAAGETFLERNGDRTLLTLPERNEMLKAAIYEYGIRDGAATLLGFGDSPTAELGPADAFAVWAWDLNAADPQPTLLWDDLPKGFSVATSEDFGVIVIQMEESAEIWRLSDRSLRVYNGLPINVSPTVSKDGRWIVWQDGQKVTVIEPVSGQLYRLIEFSDLPFSTRNPYRAPSLSDDGKFVLTGSGRGDVDVWDPESGAHVARISPFGPSSTGFYDDLVYTSFNGRTELWEVTNTSAARQLESLRVALGGLRDSAGGYFMNEWLGWFWPGEFDAGAGWIWHPQNGWSYLMGSGGQIWMWLEEAPQSWFWTSGGQYPWVYSSALGRWVAIGEFSDGFTVYFWDPETGTWLTGGEEW